MLSVGNILNESSGRQVGGFALSSLPKILQTKSPVDRTQTVVDFLVAILQPPPEGVGCHGWAQKAELLLFTTELQTLALAWRMPSPGLQLQQLIKSVKQLQLEVKQLVRCRRRRRRRRRRRSCSSSSGSSRSRS
jgi:hypothetical protein